MSEVLARQLGRQLVAAIDLFLIARGGPITSARRRQCFDALTEDDPDVPIGALGRLLDELPPAMFPLDAAPVSSTGDLRAN